MKWNAVLCSVQGPSHRRDETPCQDFGIFESVSDELLVGAIADGAGSACLAETGARKAATVALEGLKNKPWGPSPMSEEEARIFFRGIYDNVIADLKSDAENDVCCLEDYACTLLAFALSPYWTAAMQIGDGFLVVRSTGSQEYDLLFEPQHGEYANETLFVTADCAKEKMLTTVRAGPHVFLCASTDGLEHAAIVRKTMTPHGPFFSSLEAFIVSAGGAQEAEEGLRAFLEDEGLNKANRDDKTLFLCVPRGEGENRIRAMDEKESGEMG